MTPPKRLLLALALTIASTSWAAEPTPMIAVSAGKVIRCSRCPASERVEVTVSAFRLDQDEVTNAQYRACVAAKRCKPAKGKPRETELDEPVRGVAWGDANNYCKFVGKRLPTEAEWEYAAFPSPGDPEDGPRIGTRDPCKALLIAGYAGKRCPGITVNGPADVTAADIARGQTDGFHDSVGASGQEIYDLYGNVAEWVADWDAMPGSPYDYFEPKNRTDPAGPPTGTNRIIRGGSYAALDGSASGERRRAKPTARMPDVGFRCAASAK